MISFITPLFRMLALLVLTTGALYAQQSEWLLPLRQTGSLPTQRVPSILFNPTGNPILRPSNIPINNFEGYQSVGNASFCNACLDAGVSQLYLTSDTSNPSVGAATTSGDFSLTTLYDQLDQCTFINDFIDEPRTTILPSLTVNNVSHSSLSEIAMAQGEEAGLFWVAIPQINQGNNVWDKIAESTDFFIYQMDMSRPNQDVANNTGNHPAGPNGPLRLSANVAINTYLNGNSTTVNGNTPQAEYGEGAAIGPIFIYNDPTNVNLHNQRCRSVYVTQDQGVLFHLVIRLDNQTLHVVDDILLKDTIIFRPLADLHFSAWQIELNQPINNAHPTWAAVSSASGVFALPLDANGNFVDHNNDNADDLFELFPNEATVGLEFSPDGQWLYHSNRINATGTDVNNTSAGSGIVIKRTRLNATNVQPTQVIRQMQGFRNFVMSVAINGRIYGLASNDTTPGNDFWTIENPNSLVPAGVNVTPGIEFEEILNNNGTPFLTNVRINRLSDITDPQNGAIYNNLNVGFGLPDWVDGEGGLTQAQEVEFCMVACNDVVVPIRINNLLVNDTLVPYGSPVRLELYDSTCQRVFLCPGHTYVYQILDSNNNVVDTRNLVIPATVSSQPISVILDEVEDCCFAAGNTDYLQITQDLRITTNDYVNWPDKVYIADDVNIIIEPRATLDITSSDVILGARARIHVLGSGNLLAYNTVFRPCHPNQSWEGILIRSVYNGVLTEVDLKQCTFINAVNAVTIDNGVNNVRNERIAITDNTFTNCYRGIVVGVLPNGGGTSRPANLTTSISNNTFQIEETQVHQTLYHTQWPNDNATAGASLDFYGILLRQDASAVIAQNQFINASLGTNLAHFHGVVFLGDGVSGSIAHNDFTNCFRALDVGNTGLRNNINRPNNTSSGSSTNGITFEHNNITITRRFQGEAEHQVRLANGGRRVVVSHNTFVNTAPPTIDNGSTGQSAIFVGSGPNFQPAEISDNTITGFHTGVFCNRIQNVDVTNNTIKAYLYGIFMRNPMGTRLRAAIITCNDINMNWQDHPTRLPVGIRIEFPLVGTFSIHNEEDGIRHLVIANNCIKNTAVAMQLHADSTFCSRRWMPIIYSNFLYNYEFAGIDIVNLTGNIGNYIDESGNLVPGRNVFMSNHISAFDVVANSTVPTTQKVDLFNNFFQSRSTNINGNIGTVTGIDWTSYASCAHMDAGSEGQFNQTIMGQIDPINGKKRPLLFNGACRNETDDRGLVIILLGVAERLNSSDVKLTANWQQALSELRPQAGSDNYHHKKLVYQEVVQQALSLLSRAQDRQQFYTTVNQQGVLTNNDLAWLGYQYAQSIQDHALAQNKLSMIAPRDQDERELHIITQLLLNEQTTAPLNAIDYELLKEIDARRGQYAPMARDIIQARKGKHDYIFPTLPLPTFKAPQKTPATVYEFNTPGLALYPNPTSDQLNVQLIQTTEQEAVLKVYNALGQMVQTQSISAQATTLTLDVAHLPTGTYSVSLTTDKGVVDTQTFIKQ